MGEKVKQEEAQEWRRGWNAEKEKGGRGQKESENKHKKSYGKDVREEEVDEEEEKRLWAPIKTFSRLKIVIFSFSPIVETNYVINFVP